MTTRSKMNANPVRLAFLLAAVATLAAVPSLAQQPTPGGSADRRAKLHEAGVGAPLTLWPVRVLGRPNDTVADALGLVLERHGMASLASASADFDAKELAWDAIPAAFGAHVKANAGKAGVPAGSYSLYAEFLGDPEHGPTEVRFVVIDAAGETVLVDRQTPTDPAFRRTAGADPDPLGCASCVGERLFELAGWKKVAGGVRDGRFAAMWEKKSGVPDRKERALMQQRASVLREGLAGTTVAVFAPVWAKADELDGARFAAAVKQGLSCKDATAAGAGLAVAPSANQQKRLHDLAAAVKAQLQQQPISADYAVAIELGFEATGKSGFTNVVVLTKAGELVLAEFQNDQHPLFQQHAPKTLADGERLAVAMLARALR
jgi:hypothetical protein